MFLEALYLVCCFSNVSPLLAVARDELIKEIDVLRELTDDFVVQYIEHMEKDEKIYIVMELCDSGSVNDLMQICDLHFDEATLQDVMASTVLGLYYMHSKHMIHRDIKAGNLLLTEYVCCVVLICWSCRSLRLL